MTFREVAAGLVICAPLMMACAEADESAAPAGHSTTAAGEGAPRAEALEAPGARFNPRLLRRFKPVRATLGDAPPVPARVDLGRMLYHDKRLSKAGEISCNSCHPLSRYGADGEVTSLGDGGQRGWRNAPTTYHAAGAFRQFWDGRAGTVEEQAGGPILNPIEMASVSATHVERMLRSIPGYVTAFQRAFPGEAAPVTFTNVGRALGAFERGLVTPSRWDAYLAGNESALTADEVEGLRVFTNVGCMVCHTGELVGGSMFQKVGAVEPWPNPRDQGRFEITRDPGDRMMFKVPTLRNVAMTAPYFHDGSEATLDDAVRMMGRHQLGLELSSQEAGAIVTWLKALTGSIPESYVAAPELPESAGNTPQGS